MENICVELFILTYSLTYKNKTILKMNTVPYFYHFIIIWGFTPNFCTAMYNKVKVQSNTQIYQENHSEIFAEVGTFGRKAVKNLSLQSSI